MPIIYTYPFKSDPALSDDVIITDNQDAKKTKQSSLKDILDLFENNFTNTSFDIFKQVCTPIANAATGGDAIPNNAINWFYSNAVMNKWTFTGNNPEVKQQNIGGGSAVNIEVLIAAGTDVGNNVEWSLRLYDNVGNYYQLAASTGEPAPNNIGQPLQSNGPTTGGSNFTACVRQTRVATVDIKTNFFDAFATTTGELELWIRNNGAQGSVITACNVNLYN